MNNGTVTSVLRLALPALLLLAGCSWRHPGGREVPQLDRAHYQAVATQIEYPDVASPARPDLLATLPTAAIADRVEYWDLPLQEAVHMALANSHVLRDLGGLVLTSPGNVQTVHGPAVQETDPRFGVDAALSAFDASFTARAFGEQNDRPVNNVLFLGDRTFCQDLAGVELGLSKRSATGAEFRLGHSVGYDWNNTPGNPLPDAWETILEAEIRQPLLQGAGVAFNRLAGPFAAPGLYAGVLIARVNTDISLADFEMGVRDLVADVETQYWELYFAYRDLDTKLAARERALETWRRIRTLYETGRQGGEAEKEAQAREQYFRLDEEVQNALLGRQYQKSRTIPLVLRGNNGVHANERQLRLLMGIPLSDGRLIRPCDEPLMAEILFDWNQALAEALAGRAELRRQRWQVQRREMELAASRNFLLPRLDAFGRYRWRGMGEDLINSHRQEARFDNAYQNLTTGDFQEWQLGVEMQLPLGFRQAHAAVRNAELQLLREHALLREQERDVTHDLASAFAEARRAYVAAQTNFNRRLAAAQQLAALEAIQDPDEMQKLRLLDLILEAADLGGRRKPLLPIAGGIHLGRDTDPFSERHAPGV